MVRNSTKTCDICFKTMRGDYLNTHILKHEITKDLEDIVEKDAKSEAYGKQEKIRRDKSEDSLSEDHYSD